MLVSPRLGKFKRLRDDLYNFRCVYCGDSQKFENKARGYFYRKKNDFFFRCHNCDLGTTLSKVLNYVDSDLYKEYVLEKYKNNSTEKEYKFEAPKFKKRDPRLEDLIPINKLQTDHPARKYVERRLIPKEFLNDIYFCSHFFKWTKIKSKWDYPRLVIPFRDETGEVFAAQGRAFGSETPKYLTVKFDDKPKIFGLDRIDWDKRIYVVEGPIDSMFLDNCVAIAGADFNILQDEAIRDDEWSTEDTTLILDNEPRNKEIVRRMETLIDNNYELVIWPDTITQKDINDMVLEGVKDIQKLIDNNTYKGLEARLQLASWKRI
jgi:hypothetical protein|tara:strand:+ start:60 stop:1019 length:960 start_codon:yes stop_codon:yes gene_type:complete